MRVLQGTVASIVMCLTLAGCQDSDNEPTSGGSASGTSSPTDAAPATAPAASGPTITGDVFTVNAPEGWEKDPTFSTDFLDQYSDASGGNSFALAEIAGEVRPLDAVAKDNFSAFSPNGTKRKRVADTTVAGAPAYHFTAQAGFGDFDEAYGVVRGGEQVTIAFTLTGTRQERQAIIDSVLASWQWT